MATDNLPKKKTFNSLLDVFIAYLLLCSLHETCICKIAQAVLEAGIIGPLVQLLQNAEFEIKKEAAWAISNATSGGSHEQIKYLFSLS